MTQPSRPAKWLPAVALAATLAGVRPAYGLIFYSTADPSHNTIAPTDPALLDSGWQYYGIWQGYFLAYPIAPNYFISATHVGGAVGSAINFGLNYNATPLSFVTTARYDNPGTDLSIFKIAGTFPKWTPLYTKGDELGKDFVLFGNSSARGGEIRAGSEADNLRGWEWGSGSIAVRWGQNQVEDVGVAPGLGDLLVSTFDRNGLPEEATLAAGDSGGGVFINDNGVWKLAGLNYGVVSEFAYGPTPAATNFPSTGTPNSFRAAIFDAGALYYPTDGVFLPDSTADLRPISVHSRISANIAWIESVVPESSGAMAAGGAILLMAAGWQAWRSRRDHPGPG